ncbi:insulin-like peptide INSL5 [Melanerpes formicivorus]|uniref:insulin-like peptide INSL5 n=1 Tax=Melanerpes formicivorus TaxID=211600 RepID=UPI00358EBFE9
MKSSSEQALTQWSVEALSIKERASELLTSSPWIPPALPMPHWEAEFQRMRGTALLLALLVVLVAAGEGRGEGNTVKLCGRDFVRAVVFTCGGSRWKRHLTDYHYLFEGDNPLPFSQDSNSLTSTEQRLETENKELRPEMESKPSVFTKREAAKLLTTSCCSIGCSEREISSLC